MKRPVFSEITLPVVGEEQNSFNIARTVHSMQIN